MAHAKPRRTASLGDVGRTKHRFAVHRQVSLAYTSARSKKVLTAMARGIHLKRLSNNHLEILGVHDAFPENNDGDGRDRIKATDSLLVTATSEVRDCLEETLVLLQQALDGTIER